MRVVEPVALLPGVACCQRGGFVIHLEHHWGSRGSPDWKDCKAVWGCPGIWPEIGEQRLGAKGEKMSLQSQICLLDRYKAMRVDKGSQMAAAGQVYQRSSGSTLGWLSCFPELPASFHFPGLHCGQYLSPAAGQVGRSLQTTSRVTKFQMEAPTCCRRKCLTFGPNM